jgi:phenylpyruvate tautomerase PptA (4-oxalocrotonate tautomerase family)
MAQVKIYGLKTHLTPLRKQITETISSCMFDAIAYPIEKKFYRFFLLEPEDFIFPEDRSNQYTIVEISMFEGRSNEAKKALIHLLFDRFHTYCHISPQDLEITIFETPQCNWGFRGLAGDEHSLNYPIKFDPEFERK